MRYEEAMLHMEAAHRFLHEAEFDPEETVLMALTRRDIILLGLAMPYLQIGYPCLEEQTTYFQKRIVELVGEQKPEWRTTNDGSDED